MLAFIVRFCLFIYTLRDAKQRFPYSLVACKSKEKEIGIWYCNYFGLTHFFCGIIKYQ